MTASRLPAWARPKDIADLLRLSVPIAISRMAMMLMGVTDAIVLGQFAPGELPYILNSYLPIGISLGFGLGMLLGVQVLTSELLGVNREGESGRIFRRGLVAGAGMGVALMALVWLSAQGLFNWIFVAIAPVSAAAGATDPQVVADKTAAVTRILAFSLPGFMLSTVCSYYLEALRRPMLVTVVMYVGVALNLVLDLAFVGGWWGMPQMGAEGVAWATTGSRWALTLVMFALVLAYTPALRRSPVAPAGEARRQFSVGTGTAISNIAEWGGFNLTYVIATWVSLAANTVYGYSVQVMGLCFMFYLGIASATSVRVAEAVGRGNGREVKEASQLGIAATLLIGAVLMAIVLAFNDFLAGRLVRSDAMVDGVLLAPAIAALFFWVALITTFDGLQVVAAMALRAQRDIWLPSVVHVGSFFGVMIPAAFFFAIILKWGAAGVFAGVLLATMIPGIWLTGRLLLRSSRFAAVAGGTALDLA